MKRLAAVAVVCAPLLFMCGCSLVYSLFGIEPDGTVKPGGGPLGTVATLVNYWIPGATAVVGSVTTVLAAIKAKNWKKAFTSTAEVIEAGAAAGKAVVDIKEDLAGAHSKAGVGGLVDKVVQQISEKPVA